MRVIFVLAGGATGSLLRYLVGLWMAGRFGTAFPWGTLSVNIAGAFLIGLIATLADEAGLIGPDVRTLLVVGVLGGFTTFSSFSLDTIRLAEGNELLRAAAYLMATLGVGFAGTVLGIITGRLLLR